MILLVDDVHAFLEDLQKVYDDMDCSWTPEVHEVLQKYALMDETPEDIAKLLK